MNRPGFVFDASIRGVYVLVLCVWFLFGGMIASAQDTATIARLDATSKVEVVFPQGLAISADLSWSGLDSSHDLELLYTVAGDPTSTLVFVPFLEPVDGGSAHVEAAVNLQAQGIPAGVAIDFRWRVVNDGLVLAESAPQRTMWFDDRWDWSLIETDQVRVHSYDISEDHAQEILDSAQATVTDLEKRFELGTSAPLDLWIYPNTEDFRGAQQPNSRESIAGASFPGYFLIVAIIPEDNPNEIGRVILHEVSHQVLYQATHNPFTSPPLWFDEGLATHFQEGGTDGYMEMVVRAQERDELFSLDSLEVSFPYQPAQATLAYATSWSAVEYIRVTFGDEGIASLIRAFGEGESYDDAIQAALGISAAQLNDDWTAWVAGKDA